MAAKSAMQMDKADNSTNPLLDFSALPRFSHIRPKHVVPALDQLLAGNRAERERLLSKNTACTWDNFVQPLEEMEEHLHRMWSPVAHLNAVKNSETLRRAYNDALPRISEYRTEVAQDERLYRAFKQIADGREFNELVQAQNKIIENALRDFRLGGAELDVPEKRRFKEIQQELAVLSNRFQENVLDATQAWELVLSDETELAGLPETARAMARQAAEREGKTGFRFTLDAPSYIAFMTFADNRALREQMYVAYVTRASDEGPQAGRWDNSEIIVRILRLRREAAQLLDFANYAEYSLQTKTVDNVEQVLEFLQDLATRAKPVAEQELAKLQKFARSEFGVDRLEAWDIPYYAEKLRQHRYDFSQEDLRPYFPVDRVIAGMFDVVNRLYGLTIIQVDGVDSWHPDVRFYEIRDAQGELRGQFYVDLYARAHKRGGAWMDECISRKRTQTRVQTPVAYLTCNSAPPVGDRPALFSHDEVITLFHEFGHGLHHMLTKVDYLGVAGINGVPWDAVELPSQFMENWCWERDAVALIARHYQTGEPLPEKLFAKMTGARTFQAAMQLVRQLEFALFDVRLHSDYDSEGSKSVQALLDEVRKEVAVILPPVYNRFQNAFNHIFAGSYAAGYYSYKWAEVLSADAFSKFEERGIFDRNTGLEFLHNILEQGGTREPMELFVAFRGRKPKIDALLRHAGLAA
ncbi:MAG: oligopeptidase A [Acidiferrobacterales bacterium]